MMNSDPLAASNTFRRLHPTSLLFSAAATGKQFLLPILLLLFFGKGMEYELWAMLFVIPMLLYSIVKYINFRYSLGKEELIVKGGIFSRHERHIPYHRIQNIDTKRNIVHRLLNVTNVVIHTASGTTPEAVLSVLSDQDALKMRKYVFSKRAAESTEPEDLEKTEEGSKDIVSSIEKEEAEPFHTVAQANLYELIRFGITSNRGTLMVAGAFGFFWQLDVFPDQTQIEQWFEVILGIQDWTWFLSTCVLFIAVLLTLIGLRFLSICWAILTLYNFQLQRQGKELRTRFGLVTEHALTIPQHRIQRIDIKANLLHRWFKRVSIQARTAGAFQGQESSGTSRDWLMPIWPKRKIPTLLKEVQPELDYESVPWQSVELRAKRRIAKKWILLTGLLCALTALFWSPWFGLVWIPIIPLALLHAHITIKTMAYALTPNAIWFKHGWFDWQCRVVRYSKIQTITLVVSPFDRRHHMAKVTIDIANAGSKAGAITIPYLHIETAKEIQTRLRSEVEKTEFHW